MHWEWRHNNRAAASDSTSYIFSFNQKPNSRDRLIAGLIALAQLRLGVVHCSGLDVEYLGDSLVIEEPIALVIGIEILL